MVITQKRRAKILPIASGKGGVGKTELCANLGVRLGQLGHRVVLIDLDLGGSNLHSTLNVKNKNPGIGNFLSDKTLSFDSLMASTPYPNVRFVPGDVLVADIPNLTYAQKRSIIRHLERIDADYILLDLGSGASNHVVDFFLVSNSGLIVSSPHVGAILNVYSFLKNAVFRFLLRAFNQDKSVSTFLKEQIREPRPGHPPRCRTILAGMAERDGEAAQKARQFLAMLQPSLVLNMVRSTDDLNIADSLHDLVKKNLDVELQSLGALMYDETIARAHTDKTPATATGATTLVANEVDRLAQKIVQSPSFPTLALETSMYDTSYELTRIELQYDEAEQAETRQPEPDPVDAEEFIALIAAQKKRIQELQGTVRMLTIRSGGI